MFIAFKIKQTQSCNYKCLPIKFFSRLFLSCTLMGSWTSKLLIFGTEKGIWHVLLKLVYKVFALTQIFFNRP